MTSFKGYSTDVVAIQIFRSLLRDFRATHGQQFALNAELALNQSIAEFRAYEWPKLGLIDPNRFKAWKQLQLLFKRHIFTDDVHTLEDLETLSIDSFMEAQKEFQTWKEGSPRTFAVLKEARCIAKSILGRIDYDELMSYVQIGKRATLDAPLEQAFLDKKVGKPSYFTCPSAVRGWFFNNYLVGDPLLTKCVKRVFRYAKDSCERINLTADFLKLINVPKSWKTLRSITPLSLIGLFLSYAIGGVITERLNLFGLRISTLQATHRRLAKKFSIIGFPIKASQLYRAHATVDLRRASDSIMSHHLNSVLPREWYNLLKVTFIRDLVVRRGNKDVVVKTASVLPMGNNATFPVETLFFYCLIKAIGNLLKVKGTYSVYGDDLIYPVRIHPYVLQVFAELGLTINEDKSFVDSNFRESCGGDFYHGIDVRPALLPENESPFLKGKRYAAYLYNIANSLRARWSDEEIPQTINWLKRELTWSQRVIYPVPMHFPATAGWKVHSPKLHSPWYEPWKLPEIGFTGGRVAVKFAFLGQTTAGLRPIECEDVYLWDSLRAMSLPRKPREWRWWKTWLNEIPSQEMPLGASIFKWITIRHSKTKRKVRVVAEPVKKEGGFTVVDELISKEFWTQDLT